MSRALAVLAAIALAAAVMAGCGSNDHATRSAGASAAGASPASGRGALTDITSVDQLRDAFNAESGTPRLIVLAAPT